MTQPNGGDELKAMQGLAYEIMRQMKMQHAQEKEAINEKMYEVSLELRDIKEAMITLAAGVQQTTQIMADLLTNLGTDKLTQDTYSFIDKIMSEPEVGEDGQ